MLPGKFIWADLFTNDIDAARTFYEGVLGWEWRWISQPPEPYGIFSNDGVDVAGLAYRDLPGDAAYGRWVHYVSVIEVASAESGLERLGGETLIRGLAPDRGQFAIVSSPSDVLIGLLRSSSGDPPDYRARPGDWLWHQLFTRDTESAIRALTTLAEYEVTDAEADAVDKILHASGYPRAGITALPDASEAGPTWLGITRVEDVAAAARAAVILGGTIVHEIPGGMTIIADPLGALMGLARYDYGEDGQ